MKLGRPFPEAGDREHLADERDAQPGALFGQRGEPLDVGGIVRFVAGPQDQAGQHHIRAGRHG